MKKLIALVLCIAIVSSQYRNKDDTCDTNKWSEYTDADCTNEMQDALMLFMILAITQMTECKDVAAIYLMGDALVSANEEICGSKGSATKGGQ